MAKAAFGALSLRLSLTKKKKTMAIAEGNRTAPSIQYFCSSHEQLAGGRQATHRGHIPTAARTLQARPLPDPQPGTEGDPSAPRAQVPPCQPPRAVRPPTPNPTAHPSPEGPPGAPSPSLYPSPPAAAPRPPQARSPRPAAPPPLPSPRRYGNLN